MATKVKTTLNPTALAEFRELRELTKTEMAAELKISLQYYCDLESGHKGGTPVLIGRIADVLKIRKLALIANPNEQVSA